MINKKQFWQAEPYPHLVIENFLYDRKHNDVRIKVDEALLIKDGVHASFDTKIEKGKTIYNKESELGKALQPVVDTLTHSFLRNGLSELTGIPASLITPLTAYNTTQTDYKYFHQMEPGGILGSHVDHSQVYGKDGSIVDGKIHFLNCIYYLNYTIGGETLLFGKSGFGEHKNAVETDYNKLLIFLHTSQSFHGVDRLIAGNRITVYMDYYTTIEGLEYLRSTARINGCKFVPDWWKHRTTFVPSDLRNMHKYLPWYLEWMLRRRIK